MKKQITDWRKSPGHIEVLSRFLKPTDCDWGPEPEHLLGEKRKVAIDRWLSEGIIDECDSVAKAAFKYTVAELKTLLRKHGEPAYGTKATLVERALRVARDDVEKKTKSVHLWQCTEQGVQIFEEHQAAQEAAYSRARQECLAALVAKDIKQACVAHHEFKQQFDPWVERYKSYYPWQAKRLEWIFQSRPQAVGELSDKKWRQLQAVAALKTLWNLNTDDDWMPDDVPAPDGNPQRALNLVLANADYRESIPDDKLTKSVTIQFDEYDLSICDSCQELNGKRFAVKDLPEIPTPGCTNPEGCRCRLDFEYDYDDDEDDEDQFIDVDVEVGDDTATLEPLEALKQLKGMMDTDLITAEEYETKKKEILARM